MTKDTSVICWGRGPKANVLQVRGLLTVSTVSPDTVGRLPAQSVQHKVGRFSRQQRLGGRGVVVDGAFGGAAPAKAVRSVSARQTRTTPLVADPVLKSGDHNLHYRIYRDLVYWELVTSKVLQGGSVATPVPKIRLNSAFWLVLG